MVNESDLLARSPLQRALAAAPAHARCIMRTCITPLHAAAPTVIGPGTLAVLCVEHGAPFRLKIRGALRARWAALPAVSHPMAQHAAA